MATARPLSRFAPPPGRDPAPPEVPAAALECQIEPRRETVIVRPVGELDGATVGQFRDALSELLAAGFAHVVVDLRALRGIDSSGLHAVADLTSSAPASTRVDIVPGPETVHRVFVLAGLAERLPFASAPDALR